jgi:hypothetical protein
MDFYFKLVGSSDDPKHEYHQLRHESYDQVDMRFGKKNFVKDGDVLFLYAINTSRIRYLYGYAIVIGGSKDYKATNHPKWKWSKAILPVKVIKNLDKSLIHNLDLPNESQVFPLERSRKDASMIQGVGGCIKITDFEDGIALLKKINNLPQEYFRPFDINKSIESMEQTHPETALVLKQNKDQWMEYALNLMRIK